MADADEDMPTASGATGADVELDEEVQDFRFLTAFSSIKSTNNPTLPRRGDKDFEPHGSGAQADALEGARAAMHDALSHTRTHQPKAHVVGTLNIESGMTLVHAIKGQHFRAMGKTDGKGRTFLLPEEALYMLERGSLDVRWPSDEQTEAEDEGAERDRDNETLPLSLQAGYALLIGKMGLTLERYQVYANLRRLGYAMFRAPSWYDDDAVQLPEEKQDTQPTIKWTPSLIDYFTSLFATSRPLGPLLKPGLYRNYSDIYRQLALIPYHDPSTISTASAATARFSSHDNDEDIENPARVCWHVYKPQPSFRKSNPGPPDFRLAVIDARAPAMVDIVDIDRLFAEGPAAEPPSAKNMFARLKTGWRSVIIAVVDQGVISYLKVVEGGFGREKVYEQTAAMRGGKKGGGRGGARGRGGRGGARRG